MSICVLLPDLDLTVILKRCTMKVILTISPFFQIAKLVGVVSTSRAAPFQILIEYLSMGNLNSFLRQKQRDNESLSLYRLHSFSQQIWNGMNHLSEGLIVHRDLATRNCLLANAVTVKLGDFGFAEQLESLDDFIQ